MPFIGNKPSAVPLTSADIADSIITSAKIVDGTIANADINSSAAITLNKLSGNPSFRNIIINGDMQVAQRNTSVASITTTGYYTLDRFLFNNSSLGTWTMSQSTDVPSGYGFAKSLKLDCTTADASPSAGDFLSIAQRVEGQNVQYLKKGTANAVSLTLSFWVKSTKTGTFVSTIRDVTNTRRISQTYTVNTTNTWEFKTLTFAGDTTGAFANDNSSSLELQFWLGAGSTYTSGTLNTSWASDSSANFAVGQVNIADNTANDFLITGIQLEAGTSATDFEFLPIDVDLQRCLRYYEKITAEANTQLFGAGFNYNTTNGIAIVNCSKKRTTVSVTFSSTVAEFGLYSSSGSRIAATAIAASQASSISFQTTVTVASGLTAGNGTTFIANASTNPYIEISAEL
jgi:hypothetical protein